MGRTPEAPGDPPSRPPEGSDPGEAGDEDHEGHGAGASLGTAIGLNVVINAVLNALAGYGIAWLHWKDYEIAWYSHKAREVFERAFVLEDAIVQGASTAIIVTLIVAAIVHRQWDGGHLEPGRIPSLVLDEERTRGKHMTIWALGTGAVAAGAAGLLATALAGQAETVSGATFAFVRTVNGTIVGGVVGGLVTASWVTNLSAGTLTRSGLGTTLAGRTSVRASRHAVPVLLGILVITGGLGAGLAEIHTDVDVADVLPRGNQHTEAAHNLTDRFKSTYTQEMELQFQVNPGQCREDSDRNLPLRRSGDVNCGNITDEVYIRAMEEFFEFTQAYSYERTTGFGPWEETERVESPIRYQLGLPSFLKLFNWTMEGGQDEAPDSAYALPAPEDRVRWNALQDSGWELLQETMTPTMDPSHEQAVVLYMVPPDSDRSSQEIGEFMIEARDAYLEWAPANAQWQVFTDENPPMHTVDLPVANAHTSQLAEEDFEFFLPIVVVFLFLALLALFRNVKGVAVAGASLGIGVVWTYGLMGYLDIALNPLNLTVLPLIMGTGVDYSIHMVNEFLEHKSEGASDEDAFRLAGERAGFAMFLATLITVTGLAIMVASPSKLLAELGLLAAIAVVSIYLLTIVFIPAMLTVLGGTEEMGADFEPSRIMPAVGRFIHRHRIPIVVLVVGLTVVSLVGLQELEVEEFGEPALNWPEEDGLRQEHIEGLRGFYDVEEEGPIFKANAVVVEGDIADPEALAYVERLSASLQAEASTSDVVDMHTSRNLPFIIRSWLKVCCGPTGLFTGSLSEELGNRGYEEYNEYPKTQAEVEATLEEMFDSPFATFASLFVAYPNNDMTITTVSVQTGDFDNAEKAWQTFERAHERSEDAKPNDVETSFVGNTPTNYLFSEEQLPWLNYMTLAALLAAVLLVFAFTRDLRATVTVGSVVGVSSLWVLGMLPALGVGLAITLMLPLVFIFSIGSDYAVHMAWNLQQVGDAQRVYATVGKAVLFSALTDMGAFALLVPIPGTPLDGVQDLMVRDALLATVASVAVVFVTTVVLVSTFYDLDPDEDVRPEPGEELPAAS